MHCHLHRGDWNFHLTNEKKKKIKMMMMMMMMMMFVVVVVVVVAVVVVVVVEMGGPEARSVLGLAGPVSVC